MKRWFTSNAGRWFTIGAVASTLLSTSARGPYDDVAIMISVLLLVGLLALVSFALNGVRRP